MSNYCPECGKQLEEGSDFCSNCETKINPETESVYEQQTQNSGNNNDQKHNHTLDMSNQMFLETKKIQGVKQLFYPS